MYLEELLPEFRKGAKIRLSLWEKGQYLRYDIEHKNIVNDKGNDVDIAGCHLSSKDWEIYQEPIDFDYIIKNKCLCWFWDNDYKYRLSGLLSKVDKDQERPFFHRHLERVVYYGNFKNCKPIKKSEFAFYEDKKDE